MEKIKFTYYAKVNGEEKEVRKSSHEYHFACLEIRMFAKTKKQLMSRIHSELFFGLSSKGCAFRIYRTSAELAELKSQREKLYDKYVSQIVEVYTK